MNPILADIYSTILPSAPYIIAAYALLWVALLVYVLMVFRGTKKATAQLTLLEEAVADQQAVAGAEALRDPAGHLDVLFYTYRGCVGEANPEGVDEVRVQFRCVFHLGGVLRVIQQILCGCCGQPHPGGNAAADQLLA